MQGGCRAAGQQVMLPLCSYGYRQALIRECIEEYIRRHEAGAATPGELRELGGRLVRRIRDGYRNDLYSQRVWLYTAR